MQPSKSKSLSVIIPLHNEADHLCESVKAIYRVAAEACQDIDLVLVDDGSQDETWEKISTLQADLPLRAVRLSRNFGKEAAMRAGLEFARGDACIIIDGDLQHPPDLMREMVRLWNEEGYHIVDAYKAKRGDESTLYKVMAKIFNTLLTTSTGFSVSGSSDYKLLDRKVVDILIGLPERLTFYRGLTEWVGFRHARIPMIVQARTSGKSAWSFYRLATFAVNALATFSTSIMQLVTVLGVIYLIFAIVLFLQTMWRWFAGEAVQGFATLIILNLLTGTIIMLSLGIMGIYISGIYHEVKQRPRHIVQDLIDSPITGEARGAHDDQ